MVELVVASFDALALASARGDSQDRLFIPRCFLVNKIPVLISLLLATSFVPVDNEYLLSQAFARLDTSLFTAFEDEPFPTEKSNVLAEAKPQFLVACAVHGLLQPDAGARLAGESNASRFANIDSRLNRNLLVEECKGNTQRFEQLLAEKIEDFDGNAVFRVEALIEVRY